MSNNIGKTSGMVLVAAGLLLAAAPVPAQAVQRTLQLNDIYEHLVPTQLIRGDRDFDGKGPRITVSVRLSTTWGGRAILATIRMRAVENGGDRSEVRGIWRRIVWRAGGQQRINRILSGTGALIRYTSAPGANPFAAQPGGMEDGARVATIRPVPRRGGDFLISMNIMGDTTGDDIARNNNSRGNTSIRRIDFGRVTVDMDR